MSCLTTARRTQLQSRLTRKLAQLTKAYDSYDSLLDESIESYKFDSGEGSQQVKRRALENLDKAIDKLETNIDWLQQKLDGTGIAYANMRRKSDQGLR